MLTALACAATLAAARAERSDPSRAVASQRALVSGRSAALTMIDTQLHVEAIELVSIIAPESGPGSIVFVDGQRVRRTKPLREVAALGPASWSDESAGGPPGPSLKALSQSVLDLTDGQRVVGTLFETPSPGERTGDAVLMRHERFGVLSVPLDRARRYQHEATDDDRREAPTPLGKGDRIVLANGDRIEGLVDRLGPTIEIAPATKGASGTRLNADVVKRIDFANPPARGSGLTAWLSDGSVLSLRAMSSESDGGRLRAKVGLDSQPSGEIAYLLPNEIIAIAPDAGSIQGLSALARSGPTPLDSRLFTAAPTPEGHGEMGLWDLLLPGPMQVDIDLPNGARGLLAVAELPETCWTWGECELVIALVGASDRADGGGRALARIKLNADQPTSNVRLELPAKPGERLRLRVEPGVRGGIQDQVLIRRGLVVTGPK